MKKWPTLYDKSKSGKIKTWEIWVDSLYGETSIHILHGYENGKKTKTGKVISKGKNIGKSNETTIYEQAKNEAQAMWQKKVDAGMVEDVNDIGNKFNYFPMLAIKYNPKKHDLSKGYYLQPKLNGVRCIAVKKNNEVKLYSRKGKDYTKINDSLAKELAKYMANDEIWDGEIFVKNWPFERIVEAVKKKCDDTELLEFHRYDVPSIDFSFSARFFYMVAKPTSNRIKQVTTFKNILDFFTVKSFHHKYVYLGYEGVMLRDPDAKYIWNHRDKALLKYKEFQDEEFRIIGYKQGTGTDNGAILWKCRGTHNNGSHYYFDCRPKGTIDNRRVLWKNGWRYVGKMLTVRFQQRSRDGLPIFPVGLTIRDYE